MFKILLLVAALVAVAHCQADKYPAGLSPALCPNYPYCDTNVIALHAHTFSAPVARSYPAGVSPASCPNYPYCNVNVHARALPLEGFAERQYPAGVHPAACPNYPYC